MSMSSDNRAGHLVPASLATARDGGTGAGWRTIADCPSDGRMVWVFGGRHKEPNREAADGSWWRQESKSADFAHVVPTHWMADFKPDPPAALGIEARQGRDEGSVEDESPADVSATPTPDPRKEALAVLEQMRFTPEECVTDLRRQAGSGFASWDVRKLLHARADAIEAALATLSVTDQAGPAGWSKHCPTEVVRRTRCMADETRDAVVWRDCCDLILERLGAHVGASNV